MIQVPEHLRPHIAIQDYSKYTDIDHAGWRFIIRVSKDFFKKHAHKKYIDGLKETGITVDYIPRISEMDEKLKKFGWRAVTVTGFIPPAVFLEFQSLGILPIACDMRRLEHIEYTPSPDIVHEAAGHAPIIADPKYASYLKQFGEVARKVIFAKEDIEVYEAIKDLSDIKEAPGTTQDQIDAAYTRLKSAYKKVKYVSEASQLSRLGWWTIEYGLVKEGREFKIYGAGLLSSVGESYSAVHGKVKKIPLSIKCVDVDYDITKPQPQLFYVKDFKDLKKVIEQLSKRMAYKIGGMKGLEKAKKAGTVTTSVLDSGVQISGVLKDVIKKGKEPIYLQFEGPCQLSYQDVEFEGHSATYHSMGYGTPIGKIKKLNKSLDKITLRELKGLQIKATGRTRIEFKSGVVVDGIVSDVIQTKKKISVLTFKDCTVKLGSRILFSPDWGVFDLACGSKVISVFGGAADRAAFVKATNKEEISPKLQVSNLTDEHKELLPLYQKTRSLREQKIADPSLLKEVKEISIRLDKSYPNDWLLRLELIEILDKYLNSPTAENDKLEIEHLNKHLLVRLKEIGKNSRSTKSLIDRGLKLVGS